MSLARYNPTVRPPNRKKHDEQISELAAKIKSLEDERGKSSEKLRLTREAVTGYRDRRDQISADKSELEDDLNVISKAVETKKGT